MVATKGEVSPASLVIDKFKASFRTEPVVIRSPGRVNLIGEHTDYNHGFVLPAAIDKAIYMAVSPRSDGALHIVAADLGQEYKGEIGVIPHSPLHWPDYILGVIDQLQKAGYSPAGINMVFGGTIPLGAGMSSSAALECATAFSLNTLYDLDLDTLEMVRLCQKAENQFVGVQCGIMDQFASMFGRKNHVIRLDCQSLDYRYLPFNTDGIRIVLLDTMVKHSLASTEYNTRRRQCEAGVRMVQAHHPTVASLRDVTIDMLDEYVSGDPLVYRRCRYVLDENARLQAGALDLEAGDIAAFGEKMFASHEGLSLEYEVSCPEADFLVRKVKGFPGVIGARMMGGGFGGCTINLVEEDAIGALVEEIGPAYVKAMKKDLKAYVSQIEDGTSGME
jgi:galactokinase